ncbi:MAG: glycosyl hydrolase [Chloroflexota bacterium]|nr:glycosyl hydrolase [Chloroflexota bacterium]
MLGVWQPGSLRELAALEAAVGKEFAIVHWFVGWGAPDAGFDAERIRAVLELGRTPMITWESWDYRRGYDQPRYRLAAILRGDYDLYIRSWARGLRDIGERVLLRWGHEMNLGSYPWAVGVAGNTAAEYVATWRRLHAIFQQEGAVNVEWVWSPGVIWRPEAAFEPMFPGDDTVDWVALDVYNAEPWGGWRPFPEIAEESYRRLLALSRRPVMIAEIGVHDDPRKSAWIEATLRDLPRRFPRVRALVWFNEATHGFDWRIDASPEVLAAFARAVAPDWYLSRWEDP